MEVPQLGIESEAELWPTLQLQQCWILNSLHRTGDRTDIWINPTAPQRQAGLLTQCTTEGTPLMDNYPSIPTILTPLAQGEKKKSHTNKHNFHTILTLLSYFPITHKLAVFKETHIENTTDSQTCWFGSVNLGLCAKSNLLPVHLSKVFLEHSTFIHLHIAYGCFCTTTVELSWLDKRSSGQKY